MSKGTIFFSYAWNDNRGHYVTAFHEAFVLRLTTTFGGDPGALARLGIGTVTDLVFFDQSNQARMGVTEKWLAERTDQAAILVLFVGPAYLNSSWCLFEWQAFQKRLGDDATRRVMVVELEKDVLRKHAKKLRQDDTPEGLSRASRLDALESCIRNAFFYPDGTRITALMDRDGKWPLNQKFIDKVAPLADEVGDKLIEVLSAGQGELDVLELSAPRARISMQVRDELRDAAKSRLEKQGIELGAQVRSGEFSEVFAGTDTWNNVKVAVKIIVRSSRLNAICDQLFGAIERAKNHAHFNPSLINIRSVNWETEPRFLVMDYIDWPCLAHRLRATENRLDAQTVALVLANVAKAQAAALRRDLPLGPLSPSDIAVDNSWAVRISPFRIEAQMTSLLGLADGFPFRWAALSRLPPELYYGQHPTPETYFTTGQYHLGLLGVEMLRGSEPVRVRCLADLERLRTFHQTPRDYFATSESPSDKPDPALLFVLSRLLEHRPEERYNEPDALAKDLDDVANGKPPRSARNEVRSTQRKLISDECFAREFYSELTTKLGSERMKALFKSDREKQHNAFFNALKAIDSYDPDGNMFVEMRDRHAGRGISIEEVDMFRHLLVQQIKAKLDCTPRQLDAWEVLLHRPFMELRTRLR